MIDRSAALDPAHECGHRLLGEAPLLPQHVNSERRIVTLLVHGRLSEAVAELLAQ